MPSHFSLSLAAKRFFYGQRLFWSMRITIGVFIPTLVLYIVLQRPIEGVAAGTGVLFMAVMDLPGSQWGKFKEMSVCGIAVVLCSAAVAYSLHVPTLFWLCVLLLSAFGAYIMNFGVKAGLIGLNCILSVALAVSLRGKVGHAANAYLLGITIGCVWSIAYSLLVCQIWRYQLRLRALADVLFAIATQIRARARCYDLQIPQEVSRSELLQAQNLFLQNHQIARDLIVGELATLDTTRLRPEQLRLFNIAADSFYLFDEIVAAHTDFELLKQHPKIYPCLTLLKDLLHDCADALDQIAIAVPLHHRLRRQHIGPQAAHMNDLIQQLESQAPLPDPTVHATLQASVDRVRAIRKLIGKLIRDLGSRRNTSGVSIENVTAYYHAPSALFTRPQNWFSGPFVSYSIRLTLAMLLALIIGNLRHEPHSNWVVMTVAIAMRPSYGLSWQRSLKRVQGTILGCILAVGMLALIYNLYGLLAIIFVCLLLSQALAPVEYRSSATCTSIAIMLAYHLLAPQTSVIEARIIDTMIGALIALLMSRVFPYWESRQIKPKCQAMLQALSRYLSCLAGMQATNPIPFRATQRDTLMALMALGLSLDNMRLEPAKTHLCPQKIQAFINLCHLTLSLGSREAQALQNAPDSVDRQAILAAQQGLLDQRSAPVPGLADEPPNLSTYSLKLTQLYAEIMAARPAKQDT